MQAVYNEGNYFKGEIMSKTMKAKTITVTLAAEPQQVFAFLTQPENLPRWNAALCRSVRREGDEWVADSPRGSLSVRWVRDDRSGLVDLVLQVSGAELIWAMRILSNGSGAELIITVVQPQGLSDSLFHDHTRWAEKASRELKKWAESQNSSLQEQEPLPSRVLHTDPPPPTGGEGALENGSKKLFIGNLPFDWTEDKLREHFAVSGQVVTAEVATFGRSGRSRGFGFIEMSTEAETQAAIEQLHGSLAGTRKIVVRISRPRENRGPAETPSGAESSAVSPVSVDEAPSPKTPAPRAAAAPMPRRGRREVRGRFTSRQHREQRAGVIATGEYEFFPRGQAVASEGDASSEPEPGNRLNEASPYMEDTGDIENRGNRRPHHRPGRPIHRRGPRRSPRPK